MRFGKWRGVALAIALTSAYALVQAAPARAGLFHTLPGEVEAIDLQTGGPYMAPPIPYGCYAKFSLSHAAGGLGGGLGCGRCGGLGLFHRNGCGGGGLCGGGGGLCGGGGGGLCGGGGGLCGGGGGGCGFCRGLGLFGGNNCNPCGGGGGGAGGLGCGLFQGRGRCRPLCGPAPCGPSPCNVTSVVPSSQGPMPSSQCAVAGCGIKMKHRHGLGLRRACGDPCGACGGRGCGLCGMGQGQGCGACGGRGCGLCGGGLGRGCGLCGGRGCNACCGGRLGNAVRKALHIGQIKYFVGPGGPVPLTPGYVPYVVTTRSPREFFAFPPFSDLDP